ncbi:MAG: deoxyribonuclease IV, partial [bacterium]
MTLKSKNLLVGAHVSIAGGVYNAIVNGEKIGATAIQMFSKNQTRWISKPLSDEDAAKFRNDWQDSTIQEIVIHDSYLINLGSPDPVLLQKSRDAFLDEVERAEKLGVRYLIFHPGSHLETGEDVGLKTISESMNWVIDARPGYGVKLLLETTAGQGTNLG